MLRRDPFANAEALIDRVYSYVAYRIGSGPDADDVTSETFAQALRYRDGFDPKRGEPIAWLLGIARRTVARHLAERRDAGGEVPDSEATGDLAEEAARRLDVAGAVALLDERDRELVALRYGADLTARQIGELLELRTNAVEVALHRALARLRPLLEDPPAQPEQPRDVPAEVVGARSDA